MAVEHVPFILNKTQVECKSYRRPIDGVKRGILQRKTARYSNVIKNQLFGVQDLKNSVCAELIFCSVVRDEQIDQIFTSVVSLAGVEQ